MFGSVLRQTGVEVKYYTTTYELRTLHLLFISDTREELSPASINHPTLKCRSNTTTCVAINWRLETFILRYNDANIEILFKFSLY